MEWLGEACGRTQTVATDARPLWPRIQAGTFLAGLYYRLNTIYFDLSPDADDDPRRQ
jgi:DNA-binding NtrC family response regulator